MFRILMLSLFVCAHANIHAQGKPGKNAVARYDWRKDTLQGQNYNRYWDSVINQMVPYPLKSDAGSTYRFVWLRPGAGPVCVEMSRLQHHINLRRRIWEKGSPAGQPQPVSDTVFQVSEADWQTFHAKLVQSGFERMKTEKVVFGCADAAIWNLESTDAQGVHIVRRRCEIPDGFRNSCLYLLELANYDFKK